MSAHGHSEGYAKEIKLIISIIVVAVVYQFFPLQLTEPVTGTQNDTNKNSIILSSGLDNVKNPNGGYVVSRVVDGDTIEVVRDDVKTKVRLIGIDTPESVGSNPRECFGKEASKFLSSIASGETVTIETDDTQDTYDRYGRLLAYVYLIDNQMLNRKLVAEGYAYEYTYSAADPYKYQLDFKTLEGFAKREGRGLWAEDTCNGEKTIVK